MNNINWFPGCNRPHPDVDLIVAWAQGLIRTVTVERVGCTPVQQSFPTWTPSHKYSGNAATTNWLRAFMVDGDIHHATCKDGNFARAERVVLQEFGTITWLHDWLQTKPSHPVPRASRFGGQTLLSQNPLFSATPIGGTQ